MEKCYYCKEHKPIYEYNGSALPICKECCNKPVHRFAKAKETQGRNEQCACGSGKKYKKCCIPVITNSTNGTETVN